MCFTIQLSRFVVSVSQTARLFYLILNCLSRTFLIFLKHLVFRKIKAEKEGFEPSRRVNDLLPFQGSPFGQLGYFSKLPQIRRFTETTFFTLSCLYLVLFVFTEEPCALYRTFHLFVKYFFQNFLSDLASGESGIRTHAPLRTNGFQDRLVMTTSISLHMLLTAFVVFSPPTQVIFQHQYPHLSTTFLHFFQFLFLSSQISHKTR